jgi:3-oxoacyl-[acyl-carrier protein] reductase
MKTDAAERSLAGRVALVTGSARRTGSAIARRLAACGAAVMITGRTSLDQARSVADDIEQTHGADRAAAMVADITDPEQASALVDCTVARFGRLDILVNSAALRGTADVETLPFAEWRSILQSILDGAFLCSQAAVPHLARSGAGRIVNIGGISAHVSGARHTAVITAKAGLNGLTKALAYDLGPKGITVNCVAPGTMISPDDGPERAERLRGYLQSNPIPLGRAGAPEDVADAVAALCGPAFRYMTGQIVHLNGGKFLGGS